MIPGGNPEARMISWIAIINLQQPCNLVARYISTINGYRFGLVRQTIDQHLYAQQGGLDLCCEVDVRAPQFLLNHARAHTFLIAARV